MSTGARLARLEAYAQAEQERRAGIAQRIASVLDGLSRKPRSTWSGSERRVVELVEGRGDYGRCGVSPVITCIGRRRQDPRLLCGAFVSDVPPGWRLLGLVKHSTE